MSKDKGDKVLYMGPGKTPGSTRALRLKDKALCEFTPAKEGDDLKEGVILGVHEGDAYPVLRCHKVPSGATSGHKGPARVNSDAYLDGWAKVFGKKRGKKSLPN